MPSMEHGLLNMRLSGVLFNALGWFNSGAMKIVYFIISTIISFLLSWLIMVFEKYLLIIAIVIGVVMLIMIGIAVTLLIIGRKNKGVSDNA